MSNVTGLIMIMAATLCTLLSSAILAAEKVTYFVLAETVEPIMIVRDGDPMAGGLMTEIVKLVFENSGYVVEPKVLPWQRMREEFNQRDDWIIHGFPESFGSDIAYEMSELPIFPFNHVAVTLKDSGISIRDFDDLNNRTLILVENFQYPGLDGYLLEVGKNNKDTNIGVIRSFSPAGTLNMLRHRRGDVVIDWQARIVYNLPAAGLDVDSVEFHDATNIVPTENIHLVFSAKQNDEFKTFVNRRIRALSDSGQLIQLVKKYYGPAFVPDF